MLPTALKLAAAGLAVFPCRPRDKRPATEHGCKDATRDVATIKQWWQQQPDCNIGIATGTASNVFVVDVDDDGENELRKLEADHGDLPNSVEAITARGRHIYFKMPGVPIGNSTSKIALHVDVRATGGYVLAPPSVHPSGRRYCWSVDSANAFAAPPDWLLNKIAASANGNGGTAPSEWRDLVANGADEGARDCSLAGLAGHLLRRRIDPVVVLELLKSWNMTHCRPPLPVADIERVCASIAARELKRRRHDAG
jgi:bifunctional DNA primase/polymerase-like protein/primase-like protein